MATRKQTKRAAVKRAGVKRAASGAARVRRSAGAERITPQGGGSDAAAVAALLAGLDHPLRADIQSARRIILGVSPEIREGVKWNSLSFRTSEYFATLNWRCTDRVQFVFHLGAAKRDNTQKMRISDPRGLVKWLASDRALVTVGAGAELAANRAALETIVREWIEQI